jgi:hypothetical protein
MGILNYRLSKGICGCRCDLGGCWGVQPPYPKRRTGGGVEHLTALRGGREGIVNMNEVNVYKEG